MALSKAEVNEQYYNAVGGQIVFGTEGKGVLHPFAVGKLLAAKARESHATELKILELGANDCAFAISLLKVLTTLTVHGEVELTKIDYFAVEFARPSLETVFMSQAEVDDFQRAIPGADGSPLVGSLTRLGIPESTLYLVHAEAGAFVGGGSGRYDIVVVNELFDDLPCRVFYADADGRKLELEARAEEHGQRWTVAVSASETEAPEARDLPPSTLTVTSAESLAIVSGAAALLEPGGMLLIHDYGITERHVPLATYESLPRTQPDFVDLEFPPGSEHGFPRSFFRMFGNIFASAVQITTDVGFAELVDELAPFGRVIVIPHGNALLATRDSVDDRRKGDGIFLSEFGLLEPGEDLQELLARLDSTQRDLRRRFADEFLDGRASVFADLLFVKR